MNQKEGVPDLSETSIEPMYEIGTLFHDCIGGVYKYAKIVLAVYDEGEACVYQWVSWNGIARRKDYILKTRHDEM